MRVLFDTNILVSYLLPSLKKHAVTQIVEAVLQKKITLVLPQDVIDEFSKTIINKKYLSNTIDKESADILIQSLYKVAEIISTASKDFPTITRDPKDDYLIFYSILGKVDYLISGDKDLLVLKKIDKIKIISPKKFLKIIRQKK